MFALGRGKIVDFAYAMHEMTATSKSIIQQFYGRPQQYSYYKGCSTGGRQGAMNAQRYPEDFDGIIAGALANRHIQMHTAGVARSIELARHPEGQISPATAQMVTQAVLKACDTLKEGFLTNPRACTFDFKKLACAPGAAASESCLTPPQLKTVETYYGGLHNSKGELIFSGQALGNPLPALRGTADPAGRRVRHRAYLGIPERELRLAPVRSRSRYADHQQQGWLRRRRRSGPEQVQGARRQAAVICRMG
jgi:feruloyl esterase